MVSNEYLMLMLKTMWNRNIMYYMQALSQILSQGSYVILFGMVAHIFNLSITNNNSNDTNNLWCFINGLTAKQKILLDLLIPTIILSYFCSFYFISKCVCHTQSFSRKINFGKAFIAVVLLIIGSILSVLFQLLHCTNIGPYTVQFYFAYENCYGLTWILSFVSLIIIIILFSVVFIALKKMNQIQRENKKNILNSFVSKYKPQFYFWEYIIFIRRIFIALFSVTVYDGVFSFLIFVIIVIFLWIHMQCQPFIIHYANQLEGILLFCLEFVIVLQGFASIGDEFTGIAISILIFLPFVLIFYYIYKYMKMDKKRGVIDYGGFMRRTWSVNSQNLVKVSQEYRSIGDNDSK